MLLCLWDSAYKRYLAVANVVEVGGFFSRYLSGPLPYVQRYITVLKCVECVVNKTYPYESSRSSQCSTTGVTKAVVCVILYVGWCI